MERGECEANRLGDGDKREERGNHERPCRAYDDKAVLGRKLVIASLLFALTRLLRSERPVSVLSEDSPPVLAERRSGQ